MVGPPLFLLFLAALAIQRLLELRLSRRNERAMKALGGFEHEPGRFAIMAAMHVLWFVAMAIEVLVAPARLPLWVTIPAVLCFVAGQGLRYAAITRLGTRWSVRIMVCDAIPLVDGGIYRYIRHPNYLGVILEIAAAPLLGGAWRSAIVFTIANGLILLERIHSEERILASASGYDRTFMGRPRFLPRAKS
jgi:methyltransferase